MEQAAKNLEDIHKSRDTEASVMKVQPGPGEKSSFQGPCYRCGGRHAFDSCRFRDSECHYCHKRGHIAKKCRKKQPDMKRSGAPQSSTHMVREENINSDEEEEDMNVLYKMDYGRTKPIKIEIHLNGVPVVMEVDTGASLTVVNEITFNEIKSRCPSLKLEASKIKFRTFTGQIVPALGEVYVAYDNQVAELPLFVVAGNKPCLLGRNWLQTIRLNWPAILKLTPSPMSKPNEGLGQLLDQYSEVFDNSLGTMKGAKAHIYLKDDVEPKFCKPRPVPYALKDRIEQELDRLVQEGILEPVEVSEWAAPIVPIVKNDQSIRICGDYKVTVNQASKLDNYPIPKADDLFATLAGGQKFTKLDLSQAYQQMLSDGESRECLTINTHKGLFRPTRLAYGVKSAPGIFQREMEKRLSNIPYTVVRIDDILISGEDDEVHLRNVAAVLQVLRDSGLRLKRSKCKFMMNQVEYLGMNINSRGMSPVQGKVQAIQEAPAPQDVSQLQSFIGMINYYQRCIPNLSSILAPLHVLLRKDLSGFGRRNRRRHLRKPRKCCHQICCWSIMIHPRSWFYHVMPHLMGLELFFLILCLEELNSQLLMPLEH